MGLGLRLGLGLGQAGGGGSVEITAPSGFDAFGALPFTIYRTQSGTIEIDQSFNLRTHSDIDNAAGTDYYVDMVGGDDTTGLSWDHAWKAIHWGVVAANARIIYIKPGFYHNDTAGGGWQGLENKNVSIVCVGGRATLCHSKKQTYSASGNHFNSTSTTQIFDVYDLSITNADGSYQRLTLAANEAGVDSTAGTWYWTANTLSVRTSDSRTPDANIVAVIGGTNATITTTDAQTSYFENCDFLFSGGVNGLITLTGNGALLKAYFYDCTFSHSSGGALVVCTGQYDVILQNCTAQYGYTDCFNYHLTTGATLGKFIEIGCTSKYAGYLSGTGATFNASSTHDGVPGVRINGDYSYTYGTPVGDVGGSQSWNLGCESHHSLTPTPSRNNGFLAGNGGPTKMWLDTCHAHDNTYDLAPIEGEAIYTHACTLSAGQNYDDGNSGTITPY